MKLRWFPWSWIVRRAAQSFGSIDPFTVMARVRRFGQPSEYDIPLEIVRNAMMFHARGLINTRAIQNNLDWIWPYWIERQFDPRDVSFLPRSANLSHINLTHRNWTAIGLPDLALYPLIDPRGLVTPLHDSWSLEAWIIPSQGEPLIPSRTLDARQTLDTHEHAVTTETASRGLRLKSRASVVVHDGEPELRVQYDAYAEGQAQLVVSLRPYNCEGVQFIDAIRLLADGRGWSINDAQELRFGERPQHVVHSTYAEGDVVHRLNEPPDEKIECPVGMATGAACFTLRDGHRALTVSLPLEKAARREHGSTWARTTWTTARATLASLRVPDARYQAIFDAAINTLIQLTAGDVYAGPYTYRRFWFRDASLMLEALMLMGGAERARLHLDKFPNRQRRDGYFESQEGEWDSNGEVLWAMARFVDLTGTAMPDAWSRSIISAAQWLHRFRMPEDGTAHAGLLPAGFSAEHFGPNDHYYWDVFWAIGGLRAVAAILERTHQADAAFCRKLAEQFLASVERSIQHFALRRGKGAIPASPYRRMDSGAIGVLVADYPLQLYPAGEPRIARTLEHFMTHNFVNGGFFQDMTHSGVNIYLTLAIAQSLLRSGDPRWQGIVRQMMSDASPTGVWPEAIHPLTFGGCIGDGQHGWAAAEWLRWTRNAFLREEGGTLVLCSGLLPEWLSARESMHFGPSLTPWGEVRVELHPGQRHNAWTVRINATWRRERPPLLVHLPGARPLRLDGEEACISLEDVVSCERQ